MKIIKFSAPWCVPCNTFKKVFDNVKKEFPNHEFVEIDVEEDEELFEKYNIRSIPHTIIEENGNTIAVIQGLVSEDRLTDEIKKHE